MSKEAEDYVKSVEPSDFMYNAAIYGETKMMEAFDAGVESVKKNKWHDLIKDPMDLPDTDRQIILLHTNQSYSIAKSVFDNDGKFYGFTDNGSGLGIFVISNIAAWKDID